MNENRLSTVWFPGLRLKRFVHPTTVIIILGIALFSACTPLQITSVNPVEQANLRDTVRIEVLEFDTDGSDGVFPYAQILDITERKLINQLLDSMDTHFKATLKVACIPEYELHFHLQDGTIHGFGYSCHGASFIRGDQDFWRGEDYALPDQFKTLLQEQIAATYPSEVNIAAEAALNRTVKIDIFETISKTVTPSSEGKPGITEAQTLHRMTVTDPKIIAQFVDALDTVVSLHPRIAMPMPYVLQFHLNDDSVTTIGYASSDGNSDILRADQLRCFKRQDARPPSEFEALIRELLF
jgi:hypothetical protein